ncbi:MAG: peptide transporter permease [Bacilli bacterium]|nr:peptide transporter permease [Bacilli bacterium]
MARFIVRRLLYAIVTLWVIITLTFVLMHSIPGQPFNNVDKMTPTILAHLNYTYGLDKPTYQQYLIYLNNILHGNLGTSFRYEDRTVNSIIGTGFPVSATLGFEALIFSVIIGLALGVYAALKHNTWADYTAITIAVLGVSVPNIVLGPLLSYYVGVKLGWLPTGEWGGFEYTILPSITLGMTSLAFMARLMRTSMLEVLGMDYIKTAKAKGLSNREIVWRHLFRNSLLPIVTILGPLVVNIITGSIVVEETFAIPGLGSSFVESITDKDYTVIMGTTIFYSALYILSLLLVDICYGFVDPRIRLAGGRD